MNSFKHRVKQRKSALQRKRIDKFRILQSLGTHIKEIGKVSTAGYKVTYTGGDVCEHKVGINYETEINYICDKKVEFGRPKLLDWPGKSGKIDLEKEKPCTFIFEWRSKRACSQCTANDVE